MGTGSGLNAYLREQRGKCFDLGRHDCFTFTNGAWRVVYGSGYADDIIGKYAGLGPKGLKALMQATYGGKTLIECFDMHLTRVGGVPPRGALVASDRVSRWITGVALGVACGTRAVFIGDQDVVYMPIDEISGAWVR
jgi:hypothetical protein